MLAALLQVKSVDRIYPDNLTSNRLYTFWFGVRDEAGLPDLRVHDCRHTEQPVGIRGCIFSYNWG